MRRALPRNRSAAWTCSLAAALAGLLMAGCATRQAIPPQVVAEPAPAAVAPAPWVDVDPGAYHHFLRAHQFELNREYDRALSEYLAALAYAPDDREILVRTAALYLKNGDARGAIETAESALAKFPDDVDLLLFLSKLYQRENDFAQAERIYQRLIDLDPGDGTSYYLLVLAYIRQERYDEAVKVIEQARAVDRDSALPDYYLGRIDRARGNNRAAERHFKAAIRKDGLFEGAYLDLAALYEAQGRMDKARALFERVVNDVNPLSPYARDRLIQIYLEAGDLDRVLAQYDTLLEVNPRNPTLLARKALILAEKGRTDEAIDTVSRVLAIMPSDPRTLEMMGSLYEQAERFEDARAIYRRILELDPASTHALIRLGYLAHELGDAAEREAALATAEARLADNPEDSALYMFVSWAHLRAKRYEEAIDVLERAVAVDPNNVSARFSLGAAYYELKRPDDMVREMRWVIEHDPNHAFALNFLAYSFAERGINLDESVTLIKRALESNPDDGLFLDTLAWAYYKQGKYTQALKVQRKAIAAAPDADGVLYDHLGSIHLALDERREARENWLRALEIAPDDDDLKTRFREAGFGDPDTIEQVIRAREKQPADTPQDTAPDAPVPAP